MNAKALLLGAAAVLGIFALASKSKAAAAAPPPAPEPPPEPKLLAPSYAEPTYNTPPLARTAPPPVVMPAPATPDPYIEPPGPPDPGFYSAAPPVAPAPPAAPPPAAAPPAIVTQPVKLVEPPATSRPPAKMTIDVQADESNYAATPGKPAPAPAPPAKRAPAAAASELLAYVTPILKAKRGAELGSKGHPNAVVKAAQIDMGVAPADGIYGPATRKKGEALTRKSFPART